LKQFLLSIPEWVIKRSLCIHGEILLEAPIEATDEVALTLKDTMEEAGSVFLKIAPVMAEVVVADSWAEK
jgi:DNA polymerase I-like protein with 3'-5' exonuclease and polymerase domains